MTRINAGIHPCELPNQLLLGENKEITRVPELVVKALNQPVNFLGAPDAFKLGTGHVKFFYKRLAYIARRMQAITDECKRRGYQVTEWNRILFNVPWHDMVWHDWIPDDNARSILVERIVDEKGFELLPLLPEHEGHTL